ncbi:DUF3788 domain-containing protein [Candidatus Saccharibacteria bacterium]|nr:DUF3788 domain-containing protein [Candidatus Saccharibacteria bacterium]
MSQQLLHDSVDAPNEAQIADALGEKLFKLYEKFIAGLSELNLEISWYFYKDGGWLGKIMKGKKNLAFVSIWDDGVKITQFYGAKTIDGFDGLNISENLERLPAIGKILPLRLTLVNDEAVINAIKAIEYKGGAK